MASGLQPILNLPATVSASNGLVVVGDTGSATGGGLAAISNTLGTTSTGSTTGLPALLVKFV
jgi:hypothetical protein